MTDDRYADYDEPDEAHELTEGLSREEFVGSPSRQPASVTPLETRRPAPSASSAPEPRTADVSRIVTVHPRTYNDARTIGEHFRDGVPVIMNLTEMEDADAKRLVDFSAGLIFGLHGAIERVTSKVFLLASEREGCGRGQRADRRRVFQPKLNADRGTGLVPQASPQS